MHNTANTADDPLLNREELKQRFPHLPNSPNHLRRLEAKGWPPAIKISARRRVWRLSAVVAYLQKKEAEALERAHGVPGDLMRSESNAQQSTRRK